jgi:uncharacterized membrane protein YgdD (TMEM256/DUF423 family)
VDRAFLLIACLTGFLGVAFGAFGSHALRARLTPERLAQFETGVRYQLWHALALFAVVFVDVPRPFGWTSYAPLTRSPSWSPWPVIAGWLFVAGIVLFSGSLYAMALTGARALGAVTPIGGVAFLAGWLSLAWAASR